MPNPTIALIRQSLQERVESSALVRPPIGSAAVALILAGQADALSLCFIRRADRAGDPWSGHMAFPGGRADPSDPTRPSVAERETLEEIGVNLDRSELIGALREMPIRRGRVDTGMALSSFVYYIGAERTAFSLNHEVADAYWIPLSYLWDAANFTTFTIGGAGAAVNYPAIRYSGEVIWGLSYRVLEMFAEIIGLPLPSPQAP